MLEATPLLPLHVHVSPRPATLRALVWHILHFRASTSHVSLIRSCSHYVELGLLNLIVINVLVTVYGSGSSSPPDAVTRILVVVSTTVFLLEYLLRLWSCVEDPRFDHSVVLGRLAWMRRPMSLIDLVALVPYVVEAIACCSSAYDDYSHTLLGSSHARLPEASAVVQGLRLLRVLAFLRIERSYDAVKRLRIIFRKKRHELFVITYLTGAVILLSGTTIFFLEQNAQPDVFSSMGVGAWWAVETITSLGYGDAVPITVAGRIFASVVALWGIVLFAIPGALLGSGFVEVMLKHQTAKERRANAMWLQHACTQLHVPLFSELDLPPRSESSLTSSPTHYERMAETQERLVLQLHVQQVQIERILALLEATQTK
ncbi:hypothetical protein SDRG_09482 [Saprolegnia diclina VS20]|uniref:Ion transport domain-containing protein n=1 Tax=Saprolegnia diclina (strain VS20) TaxID=1156394 RepID=T0Q571_SAPDV|nr:hypothetical protein SDRG_09482 [Saprolegnia diclina VS20]EQC32954.1 hypothetical protein SDRG_09482 [Saprolegnia diclina VS20]|eukprot:XP_008613640.1 hypothetical protein SDRG_09482 [Saprolegnia diclina VS20]